MLNKYVQFAGACFSLLQRNRQARTTEKEQESVREKEGRGKKPGRFF